MGAYEFQIACPTIPVSNPTVTTATQGTAFSQNFTASGGTGPYSFSLASGTLPTGLSLATSGVLSGTPTQNGSFSITVRATDANGCSGVGATYTLVVSTATPTITGFAAVDNTVCVGSLITFTATVGSVSPPYAFTLTNGSSSTMGNANSTAFSQNLTASGTGGQTFTLTVNDGVSTTATTPVTVNALPTATITTASNLSVLDCNTTALSLSASGGGTYSWDNSLTTVSRNANAAGTYSVTVTGANGCTVVATKTLSQNITPPPVSLTATDVCAGQSVTLTATSGISSYTFIGSSGVIGSGSTNTTTVSGLSAGPQSFTVQVRSTVNSCTNTATDNATVTALPTVVVAASPSLTITSGNTVTLTASGATSYTWTGNVQSATFTASPTSTTAYSVTGLMSGCVGVTTVTVTVLAPLSLSITALSPTRNVRNALATTNVAISFDQPLNTGAASLTALRVFSAQRGGLLRNGQGGSASISGNTITLDPTTDFRPGETLLTTVLSSLESTTGAMLARGQVHQFTVETGGMGRGNFMAHPVNATLAVGDNPTGLVLGDINGDGHLDLVAANYNNDNLSVLLNNGTGGFTSNATITVGDAPQSVALGDIDADGDLDLLAVNVGHDNVSVLLNSGAGVFTPHTTSTVAVGDSPRNMALGDVDADGDLDLVTANFGSGNNVSVRLNNGTGSFMAPSSNANPAVGTNPNAVVLGDLDGDGDLDLVTANVTSDNLSVLLNNGAGSFTPHPISSTVAADNAPQSLALGDIDGDGDLDVVAANANVNTVDVLLNDGAGNFTPHLTTPLPQVGQTPRSVALGDVDRDGDLDMVVVSDNNVTPIARVLLNNGTGSFTSHPFNPSPRVGAEPRGVVLGDLDGDGDLDLVSANSTNDNISVLLNENPIPGFAAIPNPVCAGATATFTATVNNVSIAYNFTLTNGTATTTGTQSTSAFSQSWTAAGSGSQTFTLTVGYSTIVRSATTSLTVTASPTPTLTASPNATLTCAQTSLTLTATGGNSYTFAGGGLVSQNASAGTAVVNSSGPYSVTVGNGSGCTSVTSVSVSSNTTAPTVSISPTSGTLTCTQTSLTLTASSLATSLLWNTGATTTSITLNNAGTYSVTATAANGCTAASNSVIIDSNTSLTGFTVVSSASVCAGGSVTLTASGCTGGTVNWPGGITGSVFSTTTGGTYTATCTVGACSTTTTGTATIGVNPTPTLMASPNATLTCAQTSLTLTATGGTSYTFAGPSGGIISQDMNAGTAVVNASGTYSVTVANASGCASTTSITVSTATSLPSILLPSVSIGTTGVPLGNTPVVFTASGGAGSYSFAFGSLPPGLSVINPSTTQRTIGGTPTQTGVFPISVTLTDGNGCSVVGAPFTLTINCPTITLTTPSFSTATVGVNITTSLDWSAAGGSSPYSFSFSTLPTGLSIVTATADFRQIQGNISQAGTYPISLTVTDNYGCAAVASPFTLTVSCPVLLLTTPSVSTILVGVALPTTGSPLAWQALLNRGPYTFTFSPLPPGITTGSVFSDYYDLTGTPTQVGTFPISLTLTDVFGCSLVSNTYSLTTSCATLALSTTTNPTTCGPTGSIAFTTNLPNGTYSLSYVGSGSPRSVTVSSGLFSLTGLSAGSYGSFSINYGSSACILTVGTTVVLSNPAPPTVSIMPTSGTLTCAQTSLTLTATTSGTGLLWSTGATTNSITVNAANTYSVTATGANSCMAMASTTVGSGTGTVAISLPTVSTGNVGVSLPVGLLFSASGGTGTYTFVVGPLPPGLSVTNTQPTQRTIGGIPTQAGVFPLSVTVTDGNGCSAVSAPYAFTVSCPTLTLSASANLATCGGTGSLTFTTSLPNGTYSLSYVGAGSPRSVTVSSGVFALTGLSAGSYGSFSISDGGSSCVPTVGSTVVFSNPAPPTVSISGPTNVVSNCFPLNITYTAISSTTGLLWSNGATTGSIIVNSASFYSVTATGSNGCTAVATSGAVLVSFDTTPPANPTLTANVGGTLTCSQTSLTLTASATSLGALSYAFAGPSGAVGGGSGLPGGNTRPVSASGLYSVTITGSNGCTTSTSTTIYRNTTTPTAGLLANGTITCSITAITLSASGGDSYAFAGLGGTQAGIVATAGNSATVNAVGTYSVTVINAVNGCFATNTVTVINSVIGTLPVPTLSASSSVVCAGSSVRVGAPVIPSPTGLQWYRNNTLVTGQTSPTLSLGNVEQTESGSYVLVIAGGCNATTTAFNLTVNPLPTVSLIVPNGATVSGSTITLPAPLTGVNFQTTGGVSYERMIVIDRVNGYEIRQVDTNATGLFPITQTGPFRLTVTGANGCKRTVEGTVVTR